MTGRYLRIRQILLFILCGVPLVNLAVLFTVWFSPHPKIRQSGFRKAIGLFSLLSNGGLILYCLL
ncbi:MAG TPA: hypothetical protein VIK63_07170 [Haloplasmataceae bacterium]